MAGGLLLFALQGLTGCGGENGTEQRTESPLAPAWYALATNVFLPDGVAGHIVGTSTLDSTAERTGFAAATYVLSSSIYTTDTTQPSLYFVHDLAAPIGHGAIRSGPRKVTDRRQLGHV